MATERRPLISEARLHQVEKTARQQNREPADVLEEAWARYVEEDSWNRLVTVGQENSRRLGLRESDTEHLVSEDNDLLRLGGYEGIAIVKVADFLNIARSEGSSARS